jgi:hypothetical protein
LWKIHYALRLKTQDNDHNDHLPIFYKEGEKSIGIPKEDTNIVVIVGSLYGGRAWWFFDNYAA